MRLNHNLASLNIFKEQSKILQKQSTAIGRISSGYKVNKTSDDPDNLAKSESLRMQIRGAQMANRNMQDGISMLQTAEGSLGNINDMLIRVRELAIQASNDTNTVEVKNTLQNEIDEMINGIENIANSMNFNGVKLLTDGPGERNMPVSANSGEVVKIPTYNLTDSSDSNSIISKLKSINVTNASGSSNSINTIDNVIDDVLEINSKYGALENRFESGFNNLNEISERIQVAESSLRDADIAEEMMEFAKSNILVEAGNAMMAQSNRFPQDILRILENMK